MKKALQNIGEVLGSAGDEPTKVMRFSPSRDPENTQLWRRMENVRYKTDGIREDIVVRGGTATYFIDGDIDGNIITEEAFEASFDGTAKDYLLLHTSTGYVYVYNETDDALKDYGTGHGFNVNTPLQVVHNGRFVYLFDYVNEVGRYIDLKKALLHAWLSYNPEDNTRLAFEGFPSEITTGDIEERNIWGFEEGESIIVYPLREPYKVELIGVPAVYSYTYNNGKYLVRNGQPIKYDFVDYFPNGVLENFEGSGDDPTIEFYYFVPVINDELTFEFVETKIESITTGDVVFISNPWDYYIQNNTLPLDGSTLIGLPNTPDVKNGIAKTGKYKLDNTNKDTYILNQTWSVPILYRSYCYVYEFDDGSFSVPSQQNVFSVSADEIFSNLNKLQIFGVTLFLPSCPANVAQVHLFSSRWQVQRKKAVGPSDTYPNGPHFYCGAHQPDYTKRLKISDYTPDRDLVQPLGGFTTLDGGIASQFGSDQLTPRHIAAHKSGILIGGYTIKRPSPSVSNDFIGVIQPKIYVRDDSAESAVDNVFLQAAYEFSDGTLGRWVTCDNIVENWAYRPGSSIEMVPESALVSAVHLYIRDERGADPDYRFIRRVSPMDAAYFGDLFTIGAIGNYPLQPLPEGNVANETVQLDNYMAFGSPPQMIDIASQKPMEYGNRIEGLEVLAVDDDRADRVRYQLAIFTNDYPLVGYFDARIVDGDLVFQIDMERVGTPTGIQSAESIFKQQSLLLYQGYEGIYAIDARGTSLIIANDAYPQLEKPVQSAGFNARENEVWFLLPGNECVVLDLDERDVPRILEMTYPSDNAKVMRQLCQLGDRLFGCADGTLLVLDEQVIGDNGIGSGFQPVQGVLTSDYLLGMQQQLYLDVIELVGDGYSGRVYCDLQDARFDDGGGWTDDFSASIDTGLHELAMNGVLLELAARGVAPRLRIVLEPSPGGRFAGAELHYRPVEHEGAARF